MPESNGSLSHRIKLGELVIYNPLAFFVCKFVGELTTTTGLGNPRARRAATVALGGVCQGLRLLLTQDTPRKAGRPVTWVLGWLWSVRGRDTPIRLIDHLTDTSPGLFSRYRTRYFLRP